MTSFVIYCEKVAKTPTLLSVTRLLATNLMATPYTSVGKFLESLTDSDISLLSDISVDPMHANMSDIALIAMMLSAAEGYAVNTDDLDEVVRIINSMVHFLVCEDMARRGLGTIHRYNMSFDPALDGSDIFT